MKLQIHFGMNKITVPKNMELNNQSNEQKYN